MSIFSYLALSGVCQCSFFPPPLIYIHYCFWAWLRGVRIGFSLGRSQVSYSLSSTFFDYCYRNLGFPQPTPVLRVICIIATAPPPILPVCSYYPSFSFRVFRLSKSRKPTFYTVLSYSTSLAFEEFLLPTEMFQALPYSRGRIKMYLALAILVTSIGASAYPPESIDDHPVAEVRGFRGIALVSEMEYKIFQRSWKIPDTSAVVSVIYYISIVLVGVSIFACSIVGYIDFLRWIGKPPPRWFVWLGGRSRGGWLIKYWKGNLDLPFDSFERGEDDTRERGSRNPASLSQEIGQSSDFEWPNTENNFSGETQPSYDQCEDIQASAVRTRRNPRWADVVQEAEAHRQRHQPLPLLGMAIGPPQISVVNDVEDNR